MVQTSVQSLDQARSWDELWSGGGDIEFCDQYRGGHKLIMIRIIFLLGRCQVLSLCSTVMETCPPFLPCFNIRVSLTLSHIQLAGARMEGPVTVFGDVLVRSLVSVELSTDGRASIRRGEER